MLFMFSFSKYLLSTSYVADTMLSTCMHPAKKLLKNLLPCAVYFLVGLLQRIGIACVSLRS